MKEKGCPFCYRDPYILFSSENFYVTPSRGGLLEGHLLICPKNHYFGLSQTPLNFFGELDYIKEKTKNFLFKIYTSPIFFEHGEISKIKKAGACIDHAHLHVVPAKIDLIEDLLEDFVIAKKLEHLTDLKKQQIERKPYLYYENSEGERYLFEPDFEIPSQYFRQIVSEKLGNPREWNWRQFPKNEEFSKSLNKLRNFLK